MLRRFLLGILVVSLASMAWAGVPDLNNSTVTTAAAGSASVYVVPNGSGASFTEAYDAAGATVDATITLTLIDTNGDPIYLYPFSDLWLETSGGGLAYCSGGTTADASTDEMGQANWANALAAGGYSAGETAVVMVAGSPVAGGGVNVTFNSPDINGSLNIDLSDIVAFTALVGGDFSTNPLYAGDFNNDGIINLSDIVRVSTAVGAVCN